MKRAFRTDVLSLFAAISVWPGSGALAAEPGVLKTVDMVPPKPAATATAAPASTTDAPGADRLTPSELEEMLGPIALYPDPLLANVLAAAVYPTEVAEAAAFIKGGGKSEQVDAKPWEDPVKAIAKIPDAIKMMGEYPDWTTALGQAYLTQAKDVMDVIQTLRHKAAKNGALQSSPEQKITVEKEVVYIKPADPEVIYVPSYSPSVVYVDDDDDDEAVAGLIGFGVGITAGLIIGNNMDCDWHGGCVSYGWHGGGWHGSYHGHSGYHGGNYSRGNNDIDIEGDVNIGNKNVSGNTVSNRASAGNRVGKEGNAWAPNKNKPIATSQTNKTSQYKGGATAANRASTPGRTAAGSTANRATGAGTANRTGGGGAANRPSGAGGTANRPSGAGAAARPSPTPSKPSKPATPPRATPTPSSPSRTPPKQQPSGGAFNGGRSTTAESQRGASSRSSSSSSRSAGRSSGGGAGARGGGGRGGGGGRR